MELGQPWSNLTRTLSILLLLLLTVACGLPALGQSQTSTPVPTAIAVVTNGPQDESPATPRPAATAELAPCPEPAATAPAENPPTPLARTPETGQVEGTTTDCEAAYRELLARHGADYSTCVPALAQAASCPRPETLKSDLKEQINIQLILDSSGSMAEQVGGSTKLEIAKEVLTRFVDTVPETANVALRVYGHIGSNNEADRPASCRGTELLYDFQPLDATAFKSAIDSFQPTGWTPIAASLDAAREDFARFDPATSSNLIYLVSDGIETCDGDPVAAAQALNGGDVQAVVNVVGFAVDAAASRQLRETAQAGGGDYFEARNAAELQAIFEERFDWIAWTRYYTCVRIGATQALAENQVSQTQAFLCVTTNATQELARISLDATRRRARGELSPTCNDYIQATAAERNRLLQESASTDFQQAVTAAQADYQAALREAELPGTPTPGP